MSHYLPISEPSFQRPVRSPCFLILSGFFFGLLSDPEDEMSVNLYCKVSHPRGKYCTYNQMWECQNRQVTTGTAILLFVKTSHHELKAGGARFGLPRRGNLERAGRSLACLGDALHAHGSE